jgi:hypothetical protein
MVFVPGQPTPVEGISTATTAPSDIPGAKDAMVNVLVPAFHDIPDVCKVSWIDDPVETVSRITILVSVVFPSLNTRIVYVAYDLSPTTDVDAKYLFTCSDGLSGSVVGVAVGVRVGVFVMIGVAVGVSVGIDVMVGVKVGVWVGVGVFVGVWVGVTVGVLVGAAVGVFVGVGVRVGVAVGVLVGVGVRVGVLVGVRVGVLVGVDVGASRLTKEHVMISSSPVVILPHPLEILEPTTTPS